MRPIHAILAIRQRLYRELIATMLPHKLGVRIVDQVDDEWAATKVLRDLLGADDIPLDDPVVVIVSMDDTDEIPVAFSRLLCEFPEITIVSICWATARVRSFQLQIDVQEIPCTLTGLVEAIRDCANRALPW